MSRSSFNMSWFAKRLRVASAVLLGLVLPAVSGCGSGSKGARPNVIFIIVDTLRADAILDAAQRVATPNIDRLAAEGISFERAFSHAPMTLPSHTSLFSSRPPFETGVLNNWQRVPGDLPLFAEWLQGFGYDTRAVISLGTLTPVEGAGLDRGFDSYDAEFWHLAQAPDVSKRFRKALEGAPESGLFLFTHFCDPHEPYNAHGSAARSAAVTFGGRALGDVPTSEMTTWDDEVELEAGEQRLEITSDELFLLPALQLWDGDRRLDVEWEEAGLHTRTKRAVARVELPQTGRYRLRFRINDALSTDEIRARYIKEVEYVDRYIGELIEALERAGLYEESVIVFTSDHGEALGERGVIGHVQNLHDEMLHVPLIIKLPQGDERAERLAEQQSALVSHVDLVPTLLALVGLPPLEGQRGHSLLDRQAAPHIAQTHKPEAKRDSVSLRDADFKMILDPESGELSMFDLGRDPGEAVDVFASRNAEREDWPEMLRTIAKLADEVGDAGAPASGEHAELLKGLGYAGDDDE